MSETTHSQLFYFISLTTMKMGKIGAALGFEKAKLVETTKPVEKVQTIPYEIPKPAEDAKTIPIVVNPDEEDCLDLEELELDEFGIVPQDTASPRMLFGLDVEIDTVGTMEGEMSQAADTKLNPQAMAETESESINFAHSRTTKGSTSNYASVQQAPSTRSQKTGSVRTAEDNKKKKMMSIKSVTQSCFSIQRTSSNITQGTGSAKTSKSKKNKKTPAPLDSAVVTESIKSTDSRKTKVLPPTDASVHLAPSRRSQETETVKTAESKKNKKMMSIKSVTRSFVSIYGAPSNTTQGNESANTAKSKKNKKTPYPLFTRQIQPAATQTEPLAIDGIPLVIQDGTAMQSTSPAHRLIIMDDEMAMQETPPPQPFTIAGFPLIIEDGTATTLTTKRSLTRSTGTFDTFDASTIKSTNSFTSTRTFELYSDQNSVASTAGATYTYPMKAVNDREGWEKVACPADTAFDVAASAGAVMGLLPSPSTMSMYDDDTYVGATLMPQSPTFGCSALDVECADDKYIVFGDKSKMLLDGADDDTYGGDTLMSRSPTCGCSSLDVECAEDKYIVFGDESKLLLDGADDDTYGGDTLMSRSPTFGCSSLDIEWAEGEYIVFGDENKILLVGDNVLSNSVLCGSESKMSKIAEPSFESALARSMLRGDSLLDGDSVMRGSAVVQQNGVLNGDVGEGVEVPLPDYGSIVSEESTRRTGLKKKTNGNALQKSVRPFFGGKTKKKVREANLTTAE
jgi:hypothetical protein